MELYSEEVVCANVLHVGGLCDRDALGQRDGSEGNEGEERLHVVKERKGAECEYV